MLGRFKLWLIDSSAETAERFAALLTILWGLGLLFPWDTFPTTPAYAAMVRWGPEEVWGAFALALGLAQMASSAHLVNGWPHRIILWLTTALWLFLAGAAFLGNPTGQAWILDLGIVIGNVCIYLNVTYYEPTLRPKP